jgi:hypothetical protein
MPIILPLPADPFDLVIQGDEMRSFAVVQVVDAPSPIVVSGNQQLMAGQVFPVIEDDETNLGVYTQAGNRDILNSFYDGSMVAVNGCIVSPCGACIFVDLGHALINPFIQATNLFSISGITKDSTGAALDSCRVVALNSGRIEQEQVEASVGETISDGSGNYSIPVPLNTAYQLIAYKAGATDVAGITRNDVVPAHIG